MLSVFVIAAALQASAPEPKIVKPSWAALPTSASIREYYPKAARKAQVSGRVVLACAVSADGSLVDCKAEETSPPGWGFDEAALRLAPLFRMKPQAEGGADVGGGHIRIPINFGQR